MTIKNNNPAQISVSGLTCDQKRNLFKKISSDVPQLPAPLRIEVVENINSDRCDVAWYGGTAAYLHYKGCRFELSACGDVYVDFYRGDDLLFHVKDKQNAGRLGEELIHYIRSDTALKEIKAETHKEYRMEQHHNNRWECFVYDSAGGFHDLMWALDSDDFFDAIVEILPEMDQICKEVSGT